MDAPTLQLEDFSLSRLLARSWRQTYHTHRLQWYRWVLSAAAAVHLVPIVGKLYWHYATRHAPSVFPDFLSAVLSVGARVAWLFVFRDPAVFLTLRRPGKPYRLAIVGAVALLTLPNAIVHVWALRTALDGVSIVKAGVANAALALVLWIPLSALAWWMAWKFLLDGGESDREFKPTAKSGAVVRGGLRAWRRAPAAEPYVDEPEESSARAVAEDGYLARAYEEQRFAAQESSSRQHSVEAIETRNEGVEGQRGGRVPNDASRTASATDNAPSAPRCQTIAQFEYVPQSHTGPHSWLSHRIVPLIMSTFATILLVMLLMLIREDRLYDLRDPSPTIKKSLYLPLGAYLLSFYSLKHRLRASLFERFEPAVPGSWKKMLSILPSWIGTGGTFKNMDTGEITVYDPRRRAFPWRALQQPALVRSPEYLQAYNAAANNSTGEGACTSFWGHAGRQPKTTFRMRPTLHRIGFVVLALVAVLVGFKNTVFYDVPNVYEEVLRHPRTITAGDVARINRMMRLWQVVSLSEIWLVAMAFGFTLVCVGSMLVLFFRAVVRSMPKEERDKIARAAQEQMAREGRIRLE